MKKFLFIILIVLGIIIPTRVSAITDSFRVGEYLPDEYMVKLKNGSGRYQQMHTFRRNRDNKIVYCIELWEGLNENKILTGYDNSQSTYANISNDVWTRIMLLSYYGYGYQGHTDMKWYAITQMMIWETTDSDSTVYFTDTLNGNRIDKYRQERNELEDLVSKHYVLPSFAEQKFTVKSGEYLTITDTNGVLSRFNSVDNYGLIVERKGNNLTFKSSINTNKVIRINKVDTEYSFKPTVYIDSNGQDILVPGAVDKFGFNIYFVPQRYSVTVKKLDKETNSFNEKLIGTKISLLDSNGNINRTLEINEDGYLIFNDILPGDYYLKEESTDSRYKLNTELIPISITDSDVEETIYNEKIIIKLNSRSIDDETEEPALESESTFTENINILDEEISNIIPISVKEEIEVPNTYTKNKNKINYYLLLTPLGLLLIKRKKYENN